jgi:regulator of sigma D
MLNPSTPYDHWLRVDALVKRWLNQRQTLIVLMLALNEKNAAATAHPYARHSIRIQAFCQVLMDYVSAGHFEIYDELLAEAEQAGNPDAIRQAQQVYPRLQRSTDAAVRFNDIYDSPEHTSALLENLPMELSGLGLLLENRFEQEDLLISRLHSRPTLTHPAAPRAEAPGWQ